jgi:hypothetical protein
MDLSRDEMQDILEAREARQRERDEKGARELAEILSKPHSGMSRRYELGMFGDDAESEAASEDSEK